MLDISHCDIIYYVIYIICSHYVRKAISPLLGQLKSFLWDSTGLPYYKHSILILQVPNHTCGMMRCTCMYQYVTQKLKYVSYTTAMQSHLHNTQIWTDWNTQISSKNRMKLLNRTLTLPYIGCKVKWSTTPSDRRLLHSNQRGDGPCLNFRRGDKVLSFPPPPTLTVSWDSYNPRTLVAGLQKGQSTISSCRCLFDIFMLTLNL